MSSFSASTILTSRLPVTFPKVTLGITPFVSFKTRVEVPALVIAAVDFGFSSFTVPFKSSTAEILLLTSRTVFSAIFTSLKVARLTASRAVFMLSTVVFVPLKAPRFVIFPFMVTVLPAAVFIARGFVFVPIMSVSIVVFEGSVRDVPLMLRVPSPVSVIEAAFLGRVTLAAVTSLLRVIVRADVLVLYALRADARSVNLRCVVPSDTLTTASSFGIASVFITYSHSVHLYVFSPSSSAVAGFVTVPASLVWAITSFSPQIVHSFQWPSSENDQFFTLLCAVLSRSVPQSRHSYQ